MDEVTCNGSSFHSRLGFGIVEMQVFRNHTALHDEHGLDEAGDAGGRFQVAEVGLHGTDEQRLVGPAVLAVDPGDGVDLDRVADGRSGAVRFEVVDFRGRNAGLGQCGFDYLFERRFVRHGQADACAPMVDRRTADHGPDPVAVGLRVAQALQHDHAAALAAHVAVRGRVKRLALPVRRQHHRIRAQLEDSAV